MVSTERTPILCDCCGKQVMGYVLWDGVAWYFQAHGKRHTVKVLFPGNRLMNRLDNSPESSDNRTRSTTE